MVQINFDLPSFFKRDDFYEDLLLDSLVTIERRLKAKEDPSLLLDALLSSINIYLENTCISKRSNVNQEISEKFSELRMQLTARVFGGKIKNKRRAIAIGLFVEGLIFYGLPRLPAIQATAKWLKIGVSTIRGFNEAYRNSYSADARRKQFNAYYYLSPNFYIVTDLFLNNGQFPYNHPKAKKAFESLEYVFFEKHAEISEERLELLKELEKNDEKRNERRKEEEKQEEIRREELLKEEEEEEEEG
jgi:hypothetical protein